MAWLGLVKDDDVPKEQPVTAAPKPPPVQIGAYDPTKGTFGTPAPTALATALAQATPEDALAESKIVEKLKAALATSTTVGIDFYVFWQSLQSLQSIIADEPTRYRAAFGTLAAQGGRIDNILATAGHYIQVLDGKETSFEGFLEERRNAEVAAKVAEADAMKVQIQEKSEQIAKLTQEIQELQNSELTTRNAATMAEAQLNANRTTFQTVKGRMVNEINSVHAKLTSYCGTQETK